MNKQRRNSLNALQDRIAALGLDDLHSTIREIIEELESLRDEEQDAFDNLPESLQQGERGQDMEAGIDNINTALDALETLADAMDGAQDAAFEAIEDAKGFA